MLMTGRLHVSLMVEARVNGRRFVASGRSEGIPGNGDISAELRTSSPIPSGFCIGVLPYVLLTGQPSLSYVMPGAQNPFIESGGVYHAVRTLELRDRGRIVTNYSVRAAPEGLTATFLIEGETDLPTLDRVYPTIECWMPEGPGRIRGHFSMIWRSASGEFVKGEAETEYHLPAELAIDDVQYRDIQIDFQRRHDGLHQQERIVLFKADEMMETAHRRVGVAAHGFTAH